MTSPDPDAFAFNDHANQLRRDKALKVAKYLYEEGTSVATALFLDEDAQKAAEKTVGVRTSHRPDLWAIVLELLEQRYDYDARHTPDPAEGQAEGRRCTYGCAGARLYPGGWLCDEHRPQANPTTARH